MSTLVLIPTYNEKDNLPILVKDLMTISELSVMVLDDQSPDGVEVPVGKCARNHQSTPAPAS